MTRRTLVWLCVAGATAGWILWMALRPSAHLHCTAQAQRSAVQVALLCSPATTAGAVGAGGTQHINWLPLVEHAQAAHCLLLSCPDSARSLRYLTIDLLGNIAVFVPWGLALSGVFAQTERPPASPWLLATLGGTLLSLVIEILQLGVATRVTDVNDLLLNTLGAALGAALWALSKRKRR